MEILNVPAPLTNFMVKELGFWYHLRDGWLAVPARMEDTGANFEQATKLMTDAEIELRRVYKEYDLEYLLSPEHGITKQLNESLPKTYTIP